MSNTHILCDISDNRPHSMYSDAASLTMSQEMNLSLSKIQTKLYNLAAGNFEENNNCQLDMWDYCEKNKNAEL